MELQIGRCEIESRECSKVGTMKNEVMTEGVEHFRVLKFFGLFP